MMPGMIMIWYGSAVTIPDGWIICDGNNSTPNLVNKFVLGAKAGGPGPSVGDTGGVTLHSHPFEGDGHAHDLSAGTDVDNVSPDGEYYHGTSTTPAEGTTDQVDARPPWHALCYIMKTPIP